MPSAQRGLFVSFCCRAVDCTSSFSGATTMLREYRRVLSDTQAVAGEVLLSHCLPHWPCLGLSDRSSVAVECRQISMFDGTTVTLPETPENQAAYPQVTNQKPGVGFAIARVGALLSLTSAPIHTLTDGLNFGVGLRLIDNRLPLAWTRDRQRTQDVSFMQITLRFTSPGTAVSPL
jgi:hypothetical protein